MFGGGKRPSPKRWILLGAVLLLAIAAVLPPLVNIGRYHRRIAASISQSIGRPVHMSSVALRLLPLPGFELSDFLVEEKPEFGAEPLLRASSVVAYLRLSSLWRGRLEFARIHFDDASLNLVHAPDGSWNFASILVQATHASEAPTGQRRPGSTLRFPYIEATNARINFKEGNEKKALSFLNSDLSVWLDNPDEWGLHFRAQPVRTDLDIDLADTGILRIDGTLHRAASLDEMPVQLRVDWTSAPLGQLSRLTIGRDIGWRGDLSVQAEITGPADLAQIKTVFRVGGLHRAEFAPAQSLDLKSLCQASYQRASSSLENISCSSAVGQGELRLTGDIRGMQQRPQAVFTLDVHGVPGSAVLSGLQEVRDGFGAGWRVTGSLNGRFHYSFSSGHPPQLAGGMGAGSLTLIPPDSGRPFSLGAVHLLFENPGRTAASHSVSSAIVPALPALLLQPVRLSLGEPAPLTLDGRFTSTGFDLHLDGSGEIVRLRGLSKVLVWPGASGATLGPTGAATLDANIRGPWVLPLSDPDHPAAPFSALGSVVLKNAELDASYLSQPLHVVSAQGLLSPAGIAWIGAQVRYGSLEAQGRLEYPTMCSPNLCAARFQLASPALDISELQSALLGANQKGELLREILGRLDRRSIAWPRLSGILETGSLSLGKLVLHDATSDLDISGDSLHIRSLDGRFMNGALHLTGALDATGDRPHYQFDAQVTNASPTLLAEVFNERWGSGSANLSAQLKMSGFDPQELAQSATGAFHWDWSKGSFAEQNSLPPLLQSRLRFDHWSGDATIQDATIRIEHSLLTRGAEAIPLAGAISFNRELDLKSESGPGGFSVTGTLEHPRVRMLTATTATAATVTRRVR